MPTGNLPESGKKLWESVYDKALKGSCKGEKDCAARTAWSAVKGAGWKKGADGQWHKTSVAELSFFIDKATYDKTSDTRRWHGVASDTSPDLYDDEMSLELYNSFLRRMDEKPPEEFCSEFWCGGTPYLSLSHYQDLDGLAVPGIIEKIYIDGDKLKAVGTFSNTKLGLSAYKSVYEDLNGTSPYQNKVRISIMFLDWGHVHKSSGFEFVRTSIEDVCSECVKEIVEHSTTGKRYMDGMLIHLAMTRVPVNERTNMEVEKAMVTRKEDAQTIADPEIVEEIDGKSLEIGKSAAVVVKAKKEDEKEDSEDESMMMDDEMMTEEEKNKMHEKRKPKKSVFEESVTAELAAIKSLISAQKSPTTSVISTHPLDEVFANLRSQFDATIGVINPEERLQVLQEPFSLIGEKVQELVKGSTPEQPVEQDNSVVLSRMNDLERKLDMVMLSLQKKPSAPVENPARPLRRSLTATAPILPDGLNQQPTAPTSQFPKLRSVIERNAGVAR